MFVVRWVDPITGRQRQQTAGTRRDAEQLAAEIEDRQDDALIADLAWPEFRQRYNSEVLVGLSDKSRLKWHTAANWLDLLLKIETVGDINAARLSSFAAELRTRGKPETTIGAYLAEVRRSLNWAADVGIIAKAPVVKLPKRAKGVSKLSRSRPITLEEFERILAAAERVRPRDHDRWQRLLRGLWESGFRLAELLELSWDNTSRLWVDASDRLPVVRILAEGEKAHRDRVQPITPGFWQLLAEQDVRSGSCFPVGRGDQQMTDKAAGRIIAKIGNRAGVVTNAQGKTATSHDIGRRAFATRHAGTLSPAELAEWMRHASVDTTMRYYYEPQMQDLAAKVWGDQADILGDQTGDILGDQAKKSRPNAGSDTGQSEDGSADCQ